MVGRDDIHASKTRGEGPQVHHHSCASHGEFWVYDIKGWGSHLQHWSARSPLDTNATLWSAFHVKSDSERPRSFIHLGDTG